MLVIRRHWWFLARPAIPLGGLWVLLAALIAAGAFMTANRAVLDLLATAGLLLAVVLTLRWAAETLLPWYHDVYIITNQRVLLQSGLIRLRRREAALLRLQETNYTIKGAASRFLDYGDLSVATAGAQGTITFQGVAHPRRLQALLATRVRAARAEARQSGSSTPASAATLQLQRIIHGDDAARTFEPTERITTISPLAARMQTRLNLLAGETVVRAVRRHPIILIRRVALPGLGIVALLVLPYLWQDDTWALCTFAAGLATILWLAWQIVDWANDLFVVTSERLIELERTPLLFEMRNVVQLRSVQDIVLSISTASGRLLDMGDLLVETGGGKSLTWRHLPHPESLQSLIFEQMEALRQRERAREAEHLATTLSEWFREYHRLRGAP